MTETQSHITWFSSKQLILLIASILIGIVAGFLGYLIGQYFYMLFLFPFIMLGIGALLYLPILRFFRTASTPYNVLCGFLMGLMIFTTFHYVEYALFRSKIIHTFEISQNENQVDAAKSANTFLRKQTGMSGFPGYMQYQLQQFQPYVYYTTAADGKITHRIAFYLHGKNSWLYLGGEIAVLIGGAALLGFLGNSRLLMRLKLT